MKRAIQHDESPANVQRTFANALVMMVDDEPLTIDVTRVHLLDAGYSRFTSTTDPLQTPQGYLILQLVQHYAAGIPAFGVVESEIRQKLYFDQVQPALREYLSQMRRENYVMVAAGYLDSGAVEGEFKPGAVIPMTCTVPGYEGIRFDVTIESVEPERRLAWRWIPGAEQPPDESTTYVEFLLADEDGGTLVTVTESGFDRISLARRAKAFEENTKGWEEQMKALDRYVSNAR